MFVLEPKHLGLQSSHTLDLAVQEHAHRAMCSRYCRHTRCGDHAHVRVVKLAQMAVTALDAPRLKDVGYDVFIDDKEVIEIGNLRLHAIHNPGHTEGSISFAVANTPLLFTGDTLFPGGPGNTTLEGGNFATILHSIDTKLFTFPDNTIVLPGHGLDSTIGTERPHFQEWVDRGW